MVFLYHKSSACGKGPNERQTGSLEHICNKDTAIFADQCSFSVSEYVNTVSHKLNVFEEVLFPLICYIILMTDICAW